MHDGGFEGVGSHDLRAGLRVSGLSISWTGLSSVAAVGLGIGANSVVLVAFGLTGLLDTAGSVTLLAHFRHALHHDSFSERRERSALRLITLGLFAVAMLTTLESARRLGGADSARAAPAGLALSAMSIIVLAYLSQLKRRVAHRIPSRALLADGWLSATGCLLAVVAVAGTGLTSALGWWWVDPVAGAMVACGALGVGVVMARGASKPQNFGVGR